MSRALAQNEDLDLVAQSFDFLGKHTAEIIALCALGLTIYQAIVARRHNILSVQPYITEFNHRETSPGRGVLTFRLMNHGVGPAFITGFKILLDGKPVKDVDEALAEVLKDKKYNHSITRLGEGYAMPAGETKDVLILEMPLGPYESLDDTEERLNRFDVVVDYQSAYKKRATLDTRKLG